MTTIESLELILTGVIDFVPGLFDNREEGIISAGVVAMVA